MQQTSVLLRLSLCWLSSMVPSGCSCSRDLAEVTPSPDMRVGLVPSQSEPRQVPPVARLVHQQQKAYNRVEEQTKSLTQELEDLVPRVRARLLRRRAKRENKPTLRKQRTRTSKRRDRRARPPD
jgi:hypothetical protein